MYYSQEQINRAQDVGIVGYFSRLGCSCEREGREIHIHGYGGFFVKEDTQEWYIHSEQYGGKGLIDCLMKMNNITFPQALNEILCGEAPNSETKPNSQYFSYTPQTYSGKVPGGDTPHKSEKPPTEFVMPQRGNDNKRVFAYLTKTRGISPQVVNELIKADLLYQDIKGNAVFLDIKDGKPCGAEFHGTGSKNYTIGNAKYDEIKNRRIIKVEPYIAELMSQFLKDDKEIQYVGYVYPTEAKIVADPANIQTISDIAEALHNSDLETEIESLNTEVKRRLKSFNGVTEGTAGNFFEYKKSETPTGAYVFESAIDMMSFMHLHPEAKNCEFVSMGGLKPSVVETLLERNLKVALCVDNDDKGKKFCNKFRDKCYILNECEKSGVKDYNELLQIRYPKPSFIGQVQKAVKWAGKVHEKRELAREELQNGKINRNQPLEA